LLTLLARKKDEPRPASERALAGGVSVAGDASRDRGEALHVAIALAVQLVLAFDRVAAASLLWNASA
jgi:hypothetical protein